MNDMNQRHLNNSSNDFALANSFSRRQMVIIEKESNIQLKCNYFLLKTMMNSYLDPSISPELSRPTSSLADPRCTHCGKYYCQIDFIFSWISRYGNTNDQQYGIDQRIQEIISK
jgi:hypothetical protein